MVKEVVGTRKTKRTGIQDRNNHVVMVFKPNKKTLKEDKGVVGEEGGPQLSEKTDTDKKGNMWRETARTP